MADGPGRRCCAGTGCDCWSPVVVFLGELGALESGEPVFVVELKSQSSSESLDVSRPAFCSLSFSTDVFLKGALRCFEGVLPAESVGDGVPL